jgi:hypothetical protein
LSIIKDPSKRRIYTKFRISNHKLLIEYGRYQQIPREERFCKHRHSGSVEDEFHFAFECHKYDNLRNNTNNILNNIFQMQLTTKSKEYLLTHVMCNNDQVLTGLFFKFHIEMFFGQRQVPLIHCNFTITKYINILIFIYELLYFSFNLILKKKTL